MDLHYTYWRFNGFNVVEAKTGKTVFANRPEVELIDNLRLAAAAPQAVDFAIQYLYSAHGICALDDYAAPYSSEQLKEMAEAIIAKAKGEYCGTCTNSQRHGNT
jgi:ABC-type Fe3+ transport system substrate-binding protein